MWNLPYEEEEECAPSTSKGKETEESTVLISKKYGLDPHQTQVMENLLNPKEDLITAQAPAGSAKTHILASYICELLKSKQGIAIVTAPTNLAVQGVARNVCKWIPDLKVGQILILQSPVAELNYPPREGDISDRYTLNNTIKYYKEEGRVRTRRRRRSIVIISCIILHLQ